MTQDEIIEMAKQVGLFEITKDGYEVFYPDNLEAFAKLVAEASASKEREACLKIQEECQYSYGNDLAKAIRARGEQHE